MSFLKAIFWLVLIGLVTSPVLAGYLGGGFGSISGGGSGNPRSVAVPGPVAGVGIPALVVVGGYVWLSRRKQRAKGR
ncbi:hypothetical protein [Mesorhizobium sp. CN2-181]|uniref:hypothetical protein n=1 Tax=Mesorhizobium yinganensis TaxID=3157707 RepID=UPI0032B72197